MTLGDSILKAGMLSLLEGETLNKEHPLLSVGLPIRLKEI